MVINNNGSLQWHFQKVALHPLFPDRIGITNTRICPKLHYRTFLSIMITTHLLLQ